MSFFAQGTATRDDIDTTLKLGMNHPMGPLQLGKLPIIISIASPSINELSSSS
jgi:3-hydroxyacyl-CoA dehydrogenase